MLIRTLFLSFLFSSSVHAALIDAGNITRDTNSGLEWLDLSETQDLSFDQVSLLIAEGGALEGWQFASSAQVSQLLGEAGGTGTYNGTSSDNNIAAPEILDLLGALDASATFRQSYLLMSDCVPATLCTNRHAVLLVDNFPVGSNDYISLIHGFSADYNSPFVGSALVRTSVVPVPAAAWLFGSAVIGLAGIKRKK